MPITSMFLGLELTCLSKYYLKVFLGYFTGNTYKNSIPMFFVVVFISEAGRGRDFILVFRQQNVEKKKPQRTIVWIERVTQR